MAPRDEPAHVFIVRVWREPREQQGIPPEWRGVVEHVATGDRRGFTALPDVAAFITPYLKS